MLIGDVKKGIYWIYFTIGSPERDESPNETNEAGICVWVTDKLPPNHDQDQTGHNTRRRHLFSDVGIWVSGYFWV